MGTAFGDVNVSIHAISAMRSSSGMTKTAIETGEALDLKAIRCRPGARAGAPSSAWTRPARTRCAGKTLPP